MNFYSNFYSSTDEEINFNIGDRVIYTDVMGNKFEGTITSETTKNDSVVYTVDCDNGNARWGYVEQFKSI